MQNSSADNAAAIAGVAIFGVTVLLAVLAFRVMLCFRGAIEAGGYQALPLLLLLPLMNFVTIVLFAFTRWPIEEALSRARRPQSPQPEERVQLPVP